MSGARELLEQADALMRRGHANDDDVPVLVDAVADSTSGAPAAGAASADADLPTLTEAVDDARTGFAADLRAGAAAAPRVEVAADARMEVAAASTSSSLFARTDLPAPQSLEDLLLGPVGGDEVALPGHAAPARGPDAPAPPARLGASPAADWRASGAQVERRRASDTDQYWVEIREQVRTSIVQRLDIAAERLLQERLAVELRPIVERASEELLARISGELRDLIRSCIGEVVDQEIEAARARRQRPRSG